MEKIECIQMIEKVAETASDLKISMIVFSSKKLLIRPGYYGKLSYLILRTEK